MAGDARTVWEHSIPPLDKLRYSITFRELESRCLREPLPTAYANGGCKNPGNSARKRKIIYAHR